MLNLVTYQQACYDGDDIRDGIHHHGGLNSDGDVPVHGAVHQSSQQEVDVAHQHQPQAHLHQGLVVLEAGATYSWRGRGEGVTPGLRRAPEPTFM